MLMGMKPAMIRTRHRMNYVEEIASPHLDHFILSQPIRTDEDTGVDVRMIHHLLGENQVLAPGEKSSNGSRVQQILTPPSSSQLGLMKRVARKMRRATTHLPTRWMKFSPARAPQARCLETSWMGSLGRTEGRRGDDISQIVRTAEQQAEQMKI